MVIFLDGDNAPGSRTVGVAALEESDSLYVYYGSSNQYYSSPKKQMKLIEDAGCPVNFIKTDAGNNSADFAIAADAGIAAFIGDCQAIVLVSEDKHFKTICNYIRSINPKVSVCTEKNIHDAVLKYKMLDLKSLESFHSYLSEVYGKDAGSNFYDYLEQLFLENATASRLNNSRKRKKQLLYISRNEITRIHTKIHSYLRGLRKTRNPHT